MHHLHESTRSVGEALLVLGKIKKKFEKVRRKDEVSDLLKILPSVGLHRYVKTTNSTEASSDNMHDL